MKKIIIDGGKKLSGTIKIGGAKNSVVAILPATILSNSKCRIYNVPNISDVKKLNEMLTFLGASIKYNDDYMEIDNQNLVNKKIPKEYSSSLRASYYFMGAMLSKFGKAEISYPGGCVIGSRPIDFHLNAFEKMGATIEINNNAYKISAQHLHGADIFLNIPSVGATINIMLAAVLADGKTRIWNAAKEPEIANVASFLNSMGAKIYGAGTDSIVIEGVCELNEGNIEVIPDRIEAGTYLMMGVLLGDNLVIEGIIKEHLEAVITKLKEAGAKFDIKDSMITLSATKNLKATNIKTSVYPGFPTDLGQPMSTLLTQCEGESIFEETIWENRMRHIKHLNEMGADILLDGSTAKIKGITPLKGSLVSATDLRAGAAMLVAGMIADGKTEITNIEHILRGYENIVDKLTKVGAKISLVDE